MIKRLLQLVTACLQPWQSHQKKRRRRQKHRRRELAAQVAYRTLSSRQQRPQPSEVQSPESIPYSLPDSEVITTLNHALKHEKIDRQSTTTPPSPHLEANTADLISEENLPNFIRSLADSAYLYECQSRLDEAERLYRQALTLSTRHFGEGHLEITTQLRDLTRFYYCQQHYTQALPLLEQTLNILQQYQAIHYPDYGETLYQLANVYRFLEQYGKAEALYQQALSMFRQTFGPEHERTQTAYSELMQMLTMVIASDQFETMTSELPPLELDTLSDTYSWAKPTWMENTQSCENFSWMKLHSPSPDDTDQELT